MFTGAAVHGLPGGRKAVSAYPSSITADLLAATLRSVRRGTTGRAAGRGGAGRTAEPQGDLLDHDHDGSGWLATSGT
jgi:hypothetical protein